MTYGNPRNPRNPRSSNSPRGGRGGGRPFGGGRPRRGGGGRAPAPPMLLGEPSPSLAKINTMNMAKLEAKIASLDEERVRLQSKIERLEAIDPKPEDKIKTVNELIARLDALKAAAVERLAGKAERKAAREQGRR